MDARTDIAGGRGPAKAHQTPRDRAGLRHRPALRVQLLGGFACWSGPELPVRLPRGVQRLVALLCLSDRPGRAAVAGRLWPDGTERQASAGLRSALWRLHLAAPGLVDAAHGSLTLAGGVRVDVRDLERWAGQARDSRRGGVALPAAGLLGDLLPGWYDDWVVGEQERLRQLRLSALEAAAARLLSDGRLAEAAHAAHLVIRAEPLRESAHRALVQVHLAEGNPAEAVRTYRCFRATAHAELGIEPTEQMTRLVRGITAGRRVAS